MYMYHTPPSMLYFIFTDDVHASYISSRLHSSLQTMYMYYTPPSTLYSIFRDDVHVSYTSIKALFHLYRRCTYIIHFRKGFISTLKMMYMYHTLPSRLYFIFTDNVQVSYSSVKVLFNPYRRCICIIHLRQGFISTLQTS